MSTSFPVLDLILGLIFIFFLLSVVTSSIVEVILTIGRARARILEKWLLSVFKEPALNATGAPIPDKTVGYAIMDHSLTAARSGSKTATPYISAANFVSAMLESVTITKSMDNTLQLPPADLTGYITALTNSTLLSNELKRTFIGFANEAIVTATAGTGKTDMEIFRSKLEGWFDDMKDRFADQLKQGWTLWLTAVVGAVVVFCSNVDTIRIAQYLYAHPQQATEFAQKAQADYDKYKVAFDNIQKHVQPGIDTSLTALRKAVDALKTEVPATIPMGRDAGNGGDEFTHFFGWLLTLLAIMLGAPFWFDMMNKVSNIRGTGPKPASSSDIERKRV